VDLAKHLSPTERERVEARLRHNLMAWLTTVRADGQPVTVPVWFLLREDGTILVYTKPNAPKLRHLADNPKVSLVLDVNDIGRNLVRIEGVAGPVDDQPAADDNPAYLAKYTERIGAMFGTPQQFAAQFSQAVVITPTKLRT
jgi:PPOX class probable F420-dependent enzyme